MATLERVTAELQLANEYSNLILDQEVSIDQSQVTMADKLNDVCYELIAQTRLLRELTDNAADARRNSYDGTNRNSPSTPTTSSPTPPRVPQSNKTFTERMKTKYDSGVMSGQQYESIFKKPEKILGNSIESVGEVYGMAKSTLGTIATPFKAMAGLFNPEDAGTYTGNFRGNVTETDLDTQNDISRETLDVNREGFEKVVDAIDRQIESDEERARRAEREARRDATATVTSKKLKGQSPNIFGLGRGTNAAAKGGMMSALASFLGDGLIARGIAKGAGAIGAGIGAKRAAEKLIKNGDGDTDKNRPKSGGKPGTDEAKKPKPTDKPIKPNTPNTSQPNKVPKLKGLGIFSTLLGLFAMASTADALQSQLEAGEIDQEEFDRVLKDEGFSIAGATAGAIAGGGLGGILGSFFPGIGNAVGGILGSVLGAFLGEDAVNRFKNKITGGEGAPASAVTPPPPPTPEYDYPVTDYEGNVVGNFRTPEEATDYVMKNGGILGKATLVPTGTPLASVGNPTAAPSKGMAELTNIMDYQQVMLDKNKEETTTGGGSVAMVNAPSTTNVSNNTTQYQGGSIVVSNPLDNTVSNYRR